MFDFDDMEIPGLTLLQPQPQPVAVASVEVPKEQVNQLQPIRPSPAPTPFPAVVVPTSSQSAPTPSILAPPIEIQPKQEVESSALPSPDQAASASTSTASTSTVPAPTANLAVPSLKFRVRMSGFTVAPSRQANAKLQLNGDLDSMMRDWTPEEKAAHRRVVKFERSSKENLIEVSFRPLPLAEYKAGDLVINCISKTEEGSGFFTTSTDVMQLLEGIVETHLDIDVMKRLRAHLRQLPNSMLNRGDKVHTHLMQMGEPAPRKTDQSLKTYPFHALKSALHLLIEKSFCGPRPITSRTPPPKRAKRVASPTSENVARQLLPARTPRGSAQAATQDTVTQHSTGRPSRSSRQATQKRYKEAKSESELSELSQSEATDNAIAPPFKRQRTRSRSSSMSSVDSVKQFQALAEFANSITLETWLNNQSAGLGTSCAALLKEHGLHSHSQLLRFQQAGWWLEFMDLKLVGKGLSELDEFLLRKTVLAALS